MEDSAVSSGPSTQPECGLQLQLGHLVPMETIPVSEPSSARPLKKRHLFNYTMVQEKIESPSTPAIHPTFSVAPTTRGTGVTSLSIIPSISQTQSTFKGKLDGVGVAIPNITGPPRAGADLTEAVRRVFSSSRDGTPRVKWSKPRLPVHSEQPSQNNYPSKSSGPIHVRLIKPKCLRKLRASRTAKDIVKRVDCKKVESARVAPIEQEPTNFLVAEVLPQKHPGPKKSDIDIEMLTYYPPQAAEEQEGILEPTDNMVAKRTRRISTVKRATDSYEDDGDPAFNPSRKLRALKVMKPQLERRRRRSERQK